MNLCEHIIPLPIPLPTPLPQGMLEDFVVAIKDVAESVRFAFVHDGGERGGNNSGGGAANSDDGGGGGGCGGGGGGGDVEYDTWYDGDNDEDVKRVSPLGCGAVDGIHISVESVEFISHDSNSTSKSGSRSGSSSGSGSGSGSMGLASRIVGGGGSLRSSPGRAHSEIILVRLRVGWRVWQHLPSSLRRSLRETRTRSKLTTKDPQGPQGPQGTQGTGDTGDIGDTGMHAGDSGMHTGDTTYATDATGATAGSVSTSAGTRGWVTPFPVLITQGINEMQSIANALGANKLQEAVNQKGVVRLATYANAVRKSVY